MKTKEQKISTFNPNDVGEPNANLFGLPFTTDEADVVIIPVPWEVTVSYGSGTADGPSAVFNASFQVDLFDPLIHDAWKHGIAMDEIDQSIKDRSDELRSKAEEYIDMYCSGEKCEVNSSMKKMQAEINAASNWLNEKVKEKSLHFLKQDKVVGLLGGDHSTPFGMMQALAEHVGEYGILQIDAHADLRDAYEGFEFSHASIMFNALKIKEVKKLVQVGIRDYCEAEYNVIQNSEGRVKTFFDRDIKHAQFGGESWNEICARIIDELPEKVYLSFDIDGLDPKLCPNTGTPVAGGFETEQVLFLIEKIVKSGKRIIAFDINEISPGEDEWDANVGARMLYRIANMAHATQKEEILSN
jgi:agmatinase